jgi:pheromone shutdown protein TraB
MSRRVWRLARALPRVEPPRAGPSASTHRARSTRAREMEYVSDGGVETLSILRSSSTPREIYLVGTAHVSERSAREVRELIRLVKPSVVHVELCEQRLRTMRERIVDDEEKKPGESASNGKSAFVQQAVKDFLGAFAGGNVGDGLLQAAFKTFYSFFKLSGLDPGAEFKEAVKEAGCIGAKIVCADRDVTMTLRRLRESVTTMDVMAIVMGRTRPGGPPPPSAMGGSMDNIEHLVENLKTRRHIREMREYLAYQMPKIARVFVDERDEIMVEALLRCKGERVVAVVGMAHMDGIERRWEEAQKRLRLKVG